MSLVIPGERKLDYLSLTYKNLSFPDPLIDDLGLEFLPVPYGRFGYKKMAIAEVGGLSVLWDGFKDDMGVHLQISGKGCETLEKAESFTSWRERIGQWIEGGARASRIDLAIDDVSGGIAFETVYDQIQSRTATMRTKSGGYHLKWDKEHKYQTLYVGRRSADTMMRCYDKGLQLGHDTSWLRFEFEYKRTKADAVARCLVSEGWDAAIGVARSFIEFKDENHKTTDKTRRRAAKWWADLLDASKHVVKVDRGGPSTLLKTYGWVVGQVGPSIAAITAYYGGDTSWVAEVAVEGQKRMKRKHFKMAAEGLGI